MIKPPFSILILKNSHRPVTIRVSALLLVLVCAGLPTIFTILGFGLSSALKSGVSLRRGAAARIRALAPGALTARPDETGAGNTRTAADITGLFVSFTRGGGMDITFSLAGAIPGEKVYAWVVINPASSPSGEVFIYPRSPMFRGMPLDFRNGVLHDFSKEKTCTISISEGLSGISVEQFRLIVYSREGTILADKQFSVTGRTGM